MFEYRRVDFLFVLTAVKFWLQIGWGKGFHELSSNERTTHVTVDARTARSNRRSKMTWQSYFFGNHWQIDNHWHIFGWLQKLTIFGRMNIQDLYHVLGGFNHLQKLNISEKPRGWTFDAALPHCHRMFVQGDVLTEDWSDASAAQLNWRSWWPPRERRERIWWGKHYPTISHKKSPYNMFHGQKLDWPY